MKNIRLPALLVFMFCVCVTLVFAMPWSRDMYDFPSIRPFTMMLVPPEGTLPVEDGQLPMTREQAGQIRESPTPATTESIAQGRQLFQIYCTACHGQGGEGDGPVGSKLMVPPADLTSASVRERTDGYLYGTIRYGGVVMPSFGASMSAAESWAIVNYLRSSQKP